MVWTKKSSFGILKLAELRFSYRMVYRATQVLSEEQQGPHVDVFGSHELAPYLHAHLPLARVLLVRRQPPHLALPVAHVVFPLTFIDVSRFVTGTKKKKWKAISYFIYHTYL